VKQKKLSFFSQALINNAQGITITDGMVNNVKNPFLDLSSITTEKSSITTGKSTFYFLADDDDTHYDQIVLENLYNTLNSITSLEVLKSGDQTELVNLMIELFFEKLGTTYIDTFKNERITESKLKEKHFSNLDELINFIKENFYFDEDEIIERICYYINSGDDGLDNYLSTCTKKYNIGDFSASWYLVLHNIIDGSFLDPYQTATRVRNEIKEKLSKTVINNSEKEKDFLENYADIVIERLREEGGEYSGLINAIKDAQYNLLNLCLLSSSPRTKTTDGKIGYDENTREIIAPTDRKEEYYGTYCLASGVKRITNSDGSYSYEIVKAKKTNEEGKEEEVKIDSEKLKSSFTKIDALFKPDENRFVTSTISWYAMAIMYEKVAIQQMVLVEQLNQIEKINEEIRYNNKVLSTLSEMYNKAYSWAVTDAGSTNPLTYVMKDLSEIKWNGTAKDLTDYLEKTVGTGEISKRLAAPGYDCKVAIDGNSFSFPFAHFNKNGESVIGQVDRSNTTNVDVHEQGALSTISMWQDQVRMYGDSLSTDAQLMTTKMEQYIQNANSSLTTCTQAVKAVGDLCKAITQNIR
jgi:hypothetical protein